MWQALAQLGSEMIGRRHQDYFDRKAATTAFNRQGELKAWDERLANTAHQREVADLLAAGLNPILSASKGLSGAPGAPTSAVATARTGGGGSGVDFAGASAKSAQAELYKKQIEVADQDIATSKALASKYSAEAADISQGVTAELRPKQAEQLSASASQARQNVETQRQDVNESLKRMERIDQEIRESRARVPTYSSSIQLQGAQRLHFIQDLSRIRANVDLTTAEKIKLDELIKAAKVEGRIDETAYGEIMRLVKRLTSSIGFGSYKRFE